MRIFTIDVGNTNTHCAELEAAGVCASCDFPTRDFAETFDFSKLDADAFDGVCWCSVVPKVSEKLSEKLSHIPLRSVNLSYKNSPLKIDLNAPESLGQDRLAVAIGASKFLKPPYIVADMGTAVTIDLVDESNTYAGGAIAPGLAAFTSYLNEKTAQLPLLDIANVDYGMSVGKDTVEAMSVGCVKGFCKLADGIISDIERDFFGTKSAFNKTIFTGGYVKLLPKKWLAGRLVEPNLANIGLAIAFELISKKIK